MYFIAKFYWNWSKYKSLSIFGLIGLFESLFLIANTLKIFQGGYIPLSVAIFILITMLIWQWGTQTKDEHYEDLRDMTVGSLIKIKEKITDNDTIARSSIFLTARFITKKADQLPLVLTTFYDRYQELPQDIIMLNVNIDRENPHLHKERYEVVKFFENGKRGSIFSVRVNFGFMEEPNVEVILEDLASHHQINLDIIPSHWLIHVLRKRILYHHKLNLFEKMRASFYHLMDNNTLKADHYYGFGNQTQLSIEVVPVVFK